LKRTSICLGEKRDGDPAPQGNLKCLHGFTFRHPGILSAGDTRRAMPVLNAGLQFQPAEGTSKAKKNLSASQWQKP